MTQLIPQPAHRRGRGPPWRMDTNFRRRLLHRSKNAFLPTPSAFGAPVGVIASKFRTDLLHHKTRVLNYGAALF